MNNLKLCSEISLNLELQSEDEVVRFSAFDIERSRIFFVSSANFIYTTQLSAFRNGPTRGKSLFSAEVHPLDLEPEDYLTSFDYLMEKEALIVGTSGGLLLLHSVDDATTEVVGRVEGGVKCISPSPDGDLLCIISGFGQILVMTHDWDLLYEISLEEHPGGADVSESLRHPFESSVSWRGDGKYFATLNEVVNSTTMLKRLKVWERDSGALHSMSEPKAFMGTVLEWMPSGAKIAAVYDKSAERQCPSIAFYERNGLERNSFSSDGQIDAKIETLKWNCSSDLLAGVVRCEKFDAVKIWYFSNNHWYIKHEIRCLKCDGVKFTWDPTRPLQLICWTVHGKITVYNFLWISAVSENSAAFVIDGINIFVTPLSLSLIPPPMYLLSLKFPSAVRDIAFYSKNSKNSLAAFLSDGSFCAIEFPTPDSWEELEGKDFFVDASISESAFGSLLHLTWLDSHKLVGVSNFESSHSHHAELLEIDLECSEDHVPGLPTCSGWQTRLVNRTSLEGVVIGIAGNPNKKCGAFVQFEGGKIVEYISGLGFSSGDVKHDDKSFLSSCPWMSVVPVADGGSLKPCLFGLDEFGRLQFNMTIICNNCSSFSFYSSSGDQLTTHLILLTKQDILFVVDISDMLNGEVDSKYYNFVAQVSNRRREEVNRDFINIWERGAKIVGILHGDEATVLLQTARGNLECIYPRKLVLLSIVNALVQRRFRDALLMVRRHRIDFNIIVDHCGLQAFLPTSAEFVKQINNFNYITEFVCAIKNENVTETLYKSFISASLQGDANFVQDSNSGSSCSDGKVSSVLGAIRKALEVEMPASSARELCILTTLARSDPPLLEEALERIKVIRENELRDSDDSVRKFYPSAEEALKHLLWLSDADAVFEAALGLYDLKLAAIVALNAQRDPKEFLPFLQELEQMPFHIMCYNIDLRLRRFENALKHIVSAGEAHYADCMNLMKKNPQLFPLGLRLISDPIKKREVLENWGDRLSDEKCFEDAAATYLLCSCYDKALKSYRASGNWRRLFIVAGLLKFGKDEGTQLAHEICEELQALGKPGEAAKIALEYCGDLKSGISLLITARDWEEALRVAFMNETEDLISEVKDAAVECANTLIGEYQEGLEKIGKYLARYLAVRQRRLLLAAKMKSEENMMNDLDDDTASEASSNFSGMSVYTTGTGKSSASSTTTSAGSKIRDRRRQRNKGKIRPGSPGEETALVEHLKGMSPSEGARCELKSLLVALMMLGHEETAKKLQRAGESFQLSQMGAVKLAEDTSSRDTVTEQTDTLDHYVQKVKSEEQISEAFSWRSKVLLSS